MGIESPPPPPPQRTYSFYKVINMRYDLIVLDLPSNLQIVHVHNNDEANGLLFCAK